MKTILFALLLIGYSAAGIAQEVAGDKSITWQNRGPGNAAGRARDILVDPDDPTGDTWFVASAGGGIWRTSDAGSNWVPLTDDQPVLSVQCLAMAASNTDVIYAGTGESYYEFDTMNGNGVLKSTDRGVTWSLLASTDGDPRFNNVSRIIVSPTDPNLVLVSTTVGHYKVDIYPTTHIFRSTDGGLTWAQVYSAAGGADAPAAAVLQLVADPSDFSNLYATVRDVGVLKSTNAGLNWSLINNGLWDTAGPMELAVSPVNSDYLYLSTEGHIPVFVRFWMSWDAGATWMEMDNQGYVGPEAHGTIACHPTDPRIVYMGGDNISRLRVYYFNREQYAVTVLVGGDEFPYEEINDLEIVDSGGGDWYILGIGNNGVVRSSSGETDFSYLPNGMITSQFFGADKRPGSSTYIGGMLYSNIMMSPVDSGATEPWGLGGTDTGCEMNWHFDEPQKVLVSNRQNYLWRSEDGGASWESGTNGLTDLGSSTAPYVTKIGQSWQRPDDVFAVGNSGVWRSNDFGANWVLSSIPTGPWGAIEYFYDIRVSIADPDIVWAGGYMGPSGDIMVSTDAGATFSSTVDYTAVTMGAISGLATHPTEPNTAYALFSYAEQPKVLKTTDLGLTWTDISGFGTGAVSTNGFPDVAVYDLLVWPSDPSRIWVGTEIGLFESTDGGATWAPANNGLPAVGIWQLRSVEDEILVSTHGRGLWTAAVPGFSDGLVFDALFESMVQAPAGDLVLEFCLRSAYDSTQVWVDGNVVETIAANTPGQWQSVLAPVMTAGTVSAHALSFVDGESYQSIIRQADVMPMVAPVAVYSNNLDDGADLPFTVDGFNWAVPTDFLNPAYHTPHDYDIDAQYVLTLMVPIEITEVSELTFREVAIVEPGDDGAVFGDSEFWDYVVVEGTTDGMNWQTVAPGWDAADDPEWLQAYDLGQNGNDTLFRSRSIILNDTFAEDDVVLLRWRMYSDAAAIGWGWAVDDIHILRQPVAGAQSTPHAVLLEQNYPNPFNPTTTIRFYLPRDGRVKLAIYDTRGYRIRTLVDGQRLAGPQTVAWDGRDDNGRGAASGIYMYRLEVGDQVHQQKMVLIK